MMEMKSNSSNNSDKKMRICQTCGAQSNCSWPLADAQQLLSSDPSQLPPG